MIFLDIEMPRLDGISLARQLRSRDENVCLIFTTCSARYAVEGYEVRALDYLLKPVEYSVFAIKLQWALEIRKQRSAKELVISRSGGVQRVRLEDIHYIEIMNHTLYYHTWLEQQVYEERGSIADREKELAAYGFARCSTSFLLNLRYVTSVSGQVVISGGKEFPISRTKRKDFLQKLTDYLGEICL